MKLPFFALVLIAFSLTSCRTAKDRDLSETQEWMEQTYNKGHLKFGYGHLASVSAGAVNTTLTSTISYDGCKMTIHSEGYSKSGLDLNGTETDTFNLFDIDPQTIALKVFDSRFPNSWQDDCSTVISCDGAWIAFEARNEAATIRRGDKSYSFSDLVSNDVDYAKRFAKALRHAVELCGGKPSKF